MLPTVNPVESHAWQKLTLHYLEMQAVQMRQLFEEDPKRFDKFHLQFEDILIDFSKNILSEDTLSDLFALADECNLHEAIDAMFSGQNINQTEGRPVLHIALRNRSNRPIFANGQDVMTDVNKVLDQIKSFSGRLLSGEWKGYSGKPITDIVNIGIGGSDLGPLMVTEALRPYHKNIRTHFQIGRAHV